MNIKNNLENINITNKQAKTKLRQEILAIRNTLTKEQVVELSNQIINKITNSNYYKKANKICIYMPIRNEVDLTRLALNNDKDFFIPKVIGRKMEFYEYNKASLVKGAYDILEPANSNLLIPDKDTLILMPGSVFSQTGDRIGYGGGYYDKFLAKYPLCKTIGVCYDFQIVGSIPIEEYDVKPDMIISDKQQIIV